MQTIGVLNHIPWYKSIYLSDLRRGRGGVVGVRRGGAPISLMAL